MKLERPARRTSAVIPVVSMADVAFLLIIFFMVSTTFVRESGFNVELPGAQSAEPLPEPREITISLAREGGLRVDGTEVRLDDLPAALRERMEVLDTRSVLIRADRMVVYQSLVEVMDVAKEVGAGVNLAIEKLPPEPPSAEAGLGTEAAPEGQSAAESEAPGAISLPPAEAKSDELGSLDQ